MRKVIFLGNCQARRLQVLYSETYAPGNNDIVSFRASFEKLTDEVREDFATADIIVAQTIDSEHEISLAKLETQADIVAFPNIMGVFLWPYSGASHPQSKPLPYHSGGPFGGELGDRFLNRKMVSGGNVKEIADDYEKLDIAKRMNVGRMYELVLERQAQRDLDGGFDCAGLIDRHFRDEALFLSPMQFELRLFNHLAARVYRQLGVPTRESSRILGGLWKSPFPQAYLPIHPSIIEYFGLRFVTPKSGYRYYTGEMLTFRQYIERYLQFDFNEPLLKAITQVHQAEKSPSRASELLDLLQEGLSRASAPSAAAQASLSHILSLSGRRVEARAALERAAEIDPGDLNLKATLAHITMSDGDLNGAEAQLRQILADWPMAGDIWHRLAIVLSRTGDLEGAIAAATEAVQLQRFRATPVAFLAELLMRAGRDNEAEHAYRRAVSLEPRSPHIYTSMAVLLARRNDISGAIAAVREAIKLDPGNLQIQGHLGFLFASAGLLQEAEAIFIKVLEQDPRLSNVRSSYAEVLLQLCRPYEAIAEMRQAVNAEPHNSAMQQHLQNFLDRASVKLNLESSDI